MTEEIAENFRKIADKGFSIGSISPKKLDFTLERLESRMNRIEDRMKDIDHKLDIVIETIREVSK